jgi:hypothetical protein
MTTEQLMLNINSVSPELRKTMPLPEDWFSNHYHMIYLVDIGVLGMDGFRYQFREFAQECWRRCHRAS